MMSAARSLPKGSSASFASPRRTLATPASLPKQYDRLQEKDCSTVTPPYSRLINTLDKVREVLPRGSKLTLAEKILYAHLRNPEECLAGSKGLADVRGQRYLKLRPDRVAMQVRMVLHAIPF
jgi:homoaconitase